MAAQRVQQPIENRAPKKLYHEKTVHKKMTINNNCRIDATCEALKDPPTVVRTFARKGNDDHKLADQVKLAGLGSQMSLVLIFPLSKFGVEGLVCQAVLDPGFSSLRCMQGQ